MGLVDYSDSDASDTEQVPVAKPAANPSRPAFQKVVDRSNPGKIKVSLPQTSSKDDKQSDEPPAKRSKTGGGAFSGFNSFLPAPKRTGQSSTTLGNGNAAKTVGLGAGVNLKTGAAPGFSREPAPEKDYTEDQEPEQSSANNGNGLHLPPPKASQSVEQKPAAEVKLVGKPLMFRPLSVARKPAKKKITAQSSAALSNPPAPAPTPPKANTPAPRPKVSLFSMDTEPADTITTPSGEYKSMMFETPEQPTQGENPDSYSFEASYEEYTPNASQTGAPPAVPTPPVSQSLDDIAGDLNLTAAERRQLFGRQKGGRGNQSATKIINFNTDEEYLHNEELRAAGEQVVHNPVRAIAPGKHSLKQLVNAAQSQKEALEESFAKGKSNRAEAGSRYGW